MYFRDLPSLPCLPRALPVRLHLPLSVSAPAPSLGLVSRYSVLLSGPLWRVSAFISAVWGFFPYYPTIGRQLSSGQCPATTTPCWHRLPRGSIRFHRLRAQSCETALCFSCQSKARVSLVLLIHTEIRGPRHPQKSETFCPPDHQITVLGPSELRCWPVQPRGAERLAMAACGPAGHADPRVGSDSSGPGDHEPSWPHSQCLLPRFVLLWNGENVPAPPLAPRLKQLSYWPASDHPRRKQRGQWKWFLGRVWRRNSFHRCY